MIRVEPTTNVAGIPPNLNLLKIQLTALCKHWFIWLGLFVGMEIILIELTHLRSIIELIAHDSHALRTGCLGPVDSKKISRIYERSNLDDDVAQPALCAICAVQTPEESRRRSSKFVSQFSRYMRSGLGFK